MEEREHAPPPLIALDQQGDEHLIAVYYGTDRRPTGSPQPDKFYGTDWDRQSEPLASIHWGVATVSIPKDRQIGEWSKPAWWMVFASEDRGEDIVLVDVQESARDRFAVDLRDAAQRSGSRDAFVFVHGYNVSFKEAAERTAMLAHDIGFPGVPLLFSWPSRGAESAYPADEESVARSYPDLRAFLEFVVRAGKFDRVNLIAHSMGNRMLKDAVREIARDPEVGREGPFFDDIVLAAADVDVAVFERDYVPVLREVASRITLYSCEQDVALTLSQEFHGSNDRVGQRLSQYPGCHSIDASKVMRGWWAMHHSYVTECYEVLRDLRAALIDRVDISDLQRRPWLARSPQTDTCWMLVPQPLPPIGSVLYR